MSAPARVDVVPDIGGGWSVTRDAVVCGAFARRIHAGRYAVACVRALQVAGAAAVLRVVRADGRILRAHAIEGRAGRQNRGKTHRRRPVE